MSILKMRTMACQKSEGYNDWIYWKALPEGSLFQAPKIRMWCFSDILLLLFIYRLVNSYSGQKVTCCSWTKIEWCVKCPPPLRPPSCALRTPWHSLFMCSAVNQQRHKFTKFLNKTSSIAITLKTNMSTCCTSYKHRLIGTKKQQQQLRGHWPLVNHLLWQKKTNNRANKYIIVTRNNRIMNKSIQCFIKKQSWHRCVTLLLGQSQSF